MRFILLFSFTGAIKLSPQEVGLIAHNDFRKLHRDTKALSHLDTLCAGAREHAMFMADTEKFAHAEDLEEGENLYWGWSSKGQGSYDFVFSRNQNQSKSFDFQFLEIKIKVMIS